MASKHRANELIFLAAKRNVMITITKSAAEFIHKANTENTPYFRVKVTGGGCSGFSYQMEFETQKNKDDQKFEQHGLKILVDPNTLLYVVGSEIDYSTDLLNSGLKITNPSAKSTCGCGQSFSA